jgi:predicted dehydrogenase
MSQISAVVIGLGRIASLLEDDPLREKPCTHAGALSANPDCVLAGGFDRDSERRRLFAGRWGCPVYDDAALMLREIKPDLVSIATHSDSHYFYCALAAKMGAKVIVCEKPLADSLKAARKIGKLQGVRIICNHERRYSADYTEAKKVLESGRLGKLLSVNAQIYMGKTQRLVDVLWHDGTHLADAAMFLSGGVLKHKRSIGAKLTSRSGTAWLEGSLERQEGAIPFMMEIGAGRDHLVFELEFSCESGRLRIGNGVFEVGESRPSNYAENFRSLVKTKDGFEGKTGYFANMVADAVACVKDLARIPVSNAEAGLAVIKYLNAVKKWR